MVAMRKSTTGYTIVELLIVIVVIAILAAFKHAPRIAALTQICATFKLQLNLPDAVVEM